MIQTGETLKYLGENPSPVSLFPLQIPHRLACDRNGASTQAPATSRWSHSVASSITLQARTRVRIYFCCMTWLEASTVHSRDHTEPWLSICLGYSATCLMSTTCQFVLILRSTTGDFERNFNLQIPRRGKDGCTYRPNEDDKCTQNFYVETLRDHLEDTGLDGSVIL